MADYYGYGNVLKEYSSLKPNKKMCYGCGCYCDEYKQCLGFEKAKVVKKEVYLSVHSTKPTIIKKTLSCYHG